MTDHAPNNMRAGLGLAILGALVLVSAVLRMTIDRPPGGSPGLAWPDAAWATFRWTALAAAAVVGAALGLAGVLLQVLMRNPLASPSLLGVSSGAGLGVMFAVYLTWRISGGDGVVLAPGSFTMPATIGGLTVLAIVYAFGQRRGVIEPVTLILVGVVIAAICGALIMLLQHLVPAGLHGNFTTWLMGYIPQRIDTTRLVLIAGFVLLALIAAIRFGPALDVATFSDDEARSVGLPLGPFRVIVFVTAGLLTALSVAIAGPIGFVGLIAPHVARLLLGPAHRTLVVGAALAGMALVIGADAARQLIDLGAGRMPVGIFTAVIGGIMFIWLLRRGALSGDWSP